MVKLNKKRFTCRLDAEVYDTLYRMKQKTLVDASKLTNEALHKSNNVRDLDLIFEDDLKMSAMLSDEESNLEYEVYDTIDLSESSLEKIETDLPTQDFGWGCHKVTEVKDYIKQKETYICKKNTPKR